MDTKRYNAASVEVEADGGYARKLRIQELERELAQLRGEPVDGNREARRAARRGGGFKPPSCVPKRRRR